MKRWTVKDFAKLSPDEQLLEIAKANIEMYGTITPPVEASLHIKDKVCSKCKTRGHVLRDFGVMVGSDGITRPQGWCKSCRNAENYHVRPSAVTIPKAIAGKLTPQERKELMEAFAAEKGHKKDS
jgi:hypothetical protein